MMDEGTEQKTIVLDCSKREFTLGKPLMKHRKDVAMIVNELLSAHTKISKKGVDKKIENVAKSMGKSVEELAEIPFDEIPEEYRDELLKLEKDQEVSLDEIAGFQLEIIYCCLKKAPFVWDVKSSTKEDLENELDYDEGLELMQHCIPFIVKSMPGAKEKKTSSNV